jgi:hypothetical protein
MKASHMRQEVQAVATVSFDDTDSKSPVASAVGSLHQLMTTDYGRHKLNQPIERHDESPTYHALSRRSRQIATYLAWQAVNR